MTALTVPGEPRLGLVVNLPSAYTAATTAAQNPRRLPSYNPVAGHAVDDYAACPETWPRRAGTTGSYFVAVEEGRAMWLDFNVCVTHPYHVAVVVTIQGINPLTGRRTAAPALERYPDDPSVETWLRGRQNYLSTVGTPVGLFWIDGFRAQDGTVRQYVFTADSSRGVAAQLIGVDRVFAVGAAFFLSRQPKPVCLATPCGERVSVAGQVPHDSGLMRSYKPASQAWYAAGNSPMTCSTLAANGPVQVFAASTVRRSLELAAGEEINQVLYRDPTELDFWQAEPAGLVVVNYAPASQVQDILAGGRQAPSEGFLNGLTKGHPG